MSVYSEGLLDVYTSVVASKVGSHVTYTGHNIIILYDDPSKIGQSLLLSFSLKLCKGCMKKEILRASAVCFVDLKP